MLQDVVVAWNGSARARAALEWALRRRATASIRLVRVLPEGEEGASAEDACRILLEGEVQSLQGRRPDLAFSWEIARGDVGAALLQRAVPGRLLVLGTGGPTVLQLPHRSDVLADLARHAEGPVALIPLRGGTTQGPVLAGMDGTSAGVAAARIAAAEAAAERTSVVLVHVHGAPPSPDGWPGGSMDACAHELHHVFPHLLVRQRTIRGDVHRELLSSSATASMLVIGRHLVPGPGSLLERDALAGASGPLLLVRETDAAEPAPPRVVGAAAGA